MEIRNHFKLGLFLLSAICFCILYACQDIGEVSPKGKQNDSVEPRHISCEFSLLDERDKIVELFSQVIAYKVENKVVFKDQLIELLIHSDGEPNRNVFLYDVVQPITASEVSKILYDLNVTAQQYDSYKSILKCDYPLMVLKIPEWVSFVWSPEEGSSVFDYDLLDDLDLGLIPKTQCQDSEGEYNLYTYSGDARNTQIIYPNNANFSTIPVVIRQSEFHRVVDPSTLLDENGFRITDDELVFPTNSPCNPQDFLAHHTVKNYDCDNSIKIIDWFSFLIDYKNVYCPEICENDIDDDGDGLVDELASCIVISGSIDEICDNNIDDDGDGFIDEEDADCCEFYAACLRDCVKDNNEIVGVKMVSLASISTLNQNITLDDATHIRFAFYEFIAQAGGAVNKKFVVAFFLKNCSHGYGDHFLSAAGMQDVALYKARVDDSPGENGSYYTGISVGGGGWWMTNYYLNIVSPEIVRQRTLWKNEWNGALMGETVRCDIWYEDAEESTIGGSQTETVSQTESTKLGIEFGGAGMGDNANMFNPFPGFTFEASSSSTNTATSVFTYSISVEARDLGNVDLNYCDEKITHTGPSRCSPRSGNIWFDGTEYSTGVIRAFFSLFPND